MNSKNIVRIVVSSGTQKPYYIRKKGMTEDGCFIRVGASAQPMNESMIERLLSQRQVNTLSTTISSRQKLTFEQLHIYYNEHKLTLNDQFEDNLDLRNSDGAYNFLAYLLADSNGASIKVAKYAGTDKIDLIENEEYGYRCLITAIYRVLDKLDVENRTFAKITSRNRLERKLFNAVALREALVNAVVHNDYNLGWPVVEFFSDRVTITSAGGLVEGLSQEDFFNGRSVFEITPSFIVVTFPYASDFERSVKENGSHDTIKDTLNDTLKDTVNEMQLKIIGIIRSNSSVTVRELAVELGINERNVKRNMKVLKDKGLLKRVGSAKTGRWLVVEK